VYKLVVLAVLLVPSFPTSAYAHGRRADPDSWQQAWNFDPLVFVSLGLFAWVYHRGLVRLRTHVGLKRKVSAAQAVAFYLSLLVTAAALLSPLDALAEELSSLHMVQHMLLVAVAAPLFIVGSPGLVIAWGLREAQRGPGGGFVRAALQMMNAPLLWSPPLAWCVFAATLWGWHHPLPYQAALRDPLVHDAQHLTFFLAACLFWRACLDPLSVRRLSPLAAVPYLFTTAVHASALGVFLALSPVAWYADYAARTAAWGFAPLEDQQLAGLIMWMPSCLVFPAAAALLFGDWLNTFNPTTRSHRRFVRPLSALEG